MRRRTASLVIAIAIAAVVGLFALNATGPAGSSAAPQEPASAQQAPSPVQLGAVLVGGNESAPGDTDGWGLADVTIDGTDVCWKITTTAVAAITAAHIHAGPAGVSGPVVVTLNPVDDGCTTTTARVARFLKKHPTDFYVNLHNGDFPGGALRGQLSK